MKIITIVGARPQFIKAAAVSRKIKEYKEIEEIIIHTGQHFDVNMSDIFFEEMDIPRPNYNLSIHSKGHGAMTGEMLIKIEEILIKENPDWVLVYGDTNSTLAGALAASKLHIKVAHVEAGLRSFNMKMPEEQNRILTDDLSSLLFCPTEQAKTNLDKEGVSPECSRVQVVGDVMYDAMMYYSRLNKSSALLNDLPSKYVLVTCHRAENTDCRSNLEEIVAALNKLNEEISVIFPLHPRTKKKMLEYGLSFHFKTYEPLGYFDMLKLIDGSLFVLTDSGGLQKEAYFFNRPCITMRDQTEWTELVENGVSFLAGANTDKILKFATEVRQNRIEFPEGLYGDGDASSKIIDAICKYNN